MSDKKDDMVNQDLDDLTPTDNLGDQADWDNDLKDDFNEDADESEDELTDEVIEFEEDDSDDEPVAKSKGKKSILPLAIAAVLATSVGGFVIYNSGLLDSKPKIVKSKPAKKTEVSPVAIAFADPAPAEQSLELATSQKQNLGLGTPINQVAVQKTIEFDRNGSNEMIQTIDFGITENAVVQHNNELQINTDSQNQTPVHESPVEVISQPVTTVAVTQDLFQQQAATPVFVEQPVSQEIYIPQSQEQVQLTQGVSEERLQKLITSTIANSNSNSNKDSAVLSLLEQMSSRLEELKGEVTNLKSSSAAGVEKTIARLSTSEKIVLTAGRERLKGFHVINTSEDGAMSIIEIVKAPRNRVSVFFKGEKIILKAKGVFKIKDIHDSGYLVLVNDKWYIDDTLEIAKTKKVAVTNKRSEKPSVTPILTSGVIIDSDESKVIVATAIPRPDKIYNIAEGWLLNGIFNEQFLLQTPSGEWKTYKIGDKLKGLGLINGLDKNRNLIVGQYLIKLSEN